MQRRASGFALALGVNLLLLLVLWGLGVVASDKRPRSTAITIDLVPESHSAASTETTKAVVRQTRTASNQPTPKPPPIILPVKPTITPPAPAEKSQPWIEMSHDQLASAESAQHCLVRRRQRRRQRVSRSRSAMEKLLFNAEWAREPTDAELSGYLPSNPPDGWGLVACKTIAGDRVDDCIELDQYPHGSHLAAAVRQAAWQFRVRPPRKGGRELVGSWVRIRIDYSFSRSGSGADD